LAIADRRAARPLGAEVHKDLAKCVERLAEVTMSDKQFAKAIFSALSLV
jgi:hypothetical protein